MGERGFSEATIDRVMQLFDLLAVNSSAERLAGMKALFAEGDEEANAAYEEVVELMSMAQASGVPDAQLVFDPTLARGLIITPEPFLKCGCPMLPSAASVVEDAMPTSRASSDGMG